MAHGTLELTLISAQDLKDVNIFSSLRVYAVVWLSSAPRHRHRTAPDREGRRSPNWNSTFRLPIPSNPSAVLHVLLRSRGALFDSNVGEVHVPLRDLLSAAASVAPASPQFLSYQVRRPVSGRAKGVLHLSYKLADAISNRTLMASPLHKSAEPLTAYPPPSSSPPPAPNFHDPVMAYPPPHPYGGYQPVYQPAPYGYTPPGPGRMGYGYPTAAHGFGAPMPTAASAPPVAARGRSKMGLGIGAGLLGGALGGMLIGDVISDVGAYSAGYEAGFTDGFDY